MTLKGEFDGVRYKVEDGLLEMKIPTWRAKSIISILSDLTRRFSRKEKATSEDFLAVHRISRMCYELSLEGVDPETRTVSMVDREEADILWGVPVDWSTEWIWKILGGLPALRKTGDVSIIVADHFAKSVEIIHED